MKFQGFNLYKRPLNILFKPANYFLERRMLYILETAFRTFLYGIILQN